MTERLHKPPEHLYRGIVVPLSVIDEAFLTSPLMPGAEPATDELGRQTVHDGNEYGLYMSDNKHMVKAAYADPRHGHTLEGVPHVTVPKVGVLYQINPAGLDVKKPWITKPLHGVYNNGFGGDEWITSSVPASNYQILEFKLGRDLIEPAAEYPVEGEPHTALEQVRADFGARVGNLTVLGAQLAALPEWKRRSDLHVRRLAAARRTRH